MKDETTNKNYIDISVSLRHSRQVPGNARSPSVEQRLVDTTSGDVTPKW